jgi:alpha-N-arabinofuranosidase
MRQPWDLYLILTTCIVLAAGSRACALRQETTAMTTALQVRVTNQVLHPVSPLLFGQFFEKPSWGNESGPEAAVVPGTHQLDPRVEALMQAMAIPIVRFPGGTDVDYLDWRDMVSEAHGAGTGRPNSCARHPAPIVTNAFGYDEYFRLAGRLGWQTILVVNLRDGLLTGKPLTEAADHAAALLAYCAGEAATVPAAFRHWPALRAANGHPAPYAVEYVQLGNESWFWADAMQQKHGDGWVAAWADGIAAYIAAVRRIAPGVKIIVDAYPLEVAAELARHRAGVELFALHRYYPWGITEFYAPDGSPLAPEAVTAGQVWETLAHSTETDAAGLAQWQDRAIAQAQRLGYRLAMTEWNLNGWLKGELWPGPGGCGLGAAVMLQATLRRGDVIALATQSMLVGQAWGITGIRVGPGADRPPRYLPTAEVTTLYRRYHGDRRLDVQYQHAPPWWKLEVGFARAGRPTEQAMPVDVVATRDAAHLYLHIINAAYAQPYRLQVQVEGLSLAGGQADLHRLRFLTRAEAKPDGPWTLTETATLRGTRTGWQVPVPSRSVTIVVLPLRECAALR